jgi:hypothetical protein
MKLYLLERSVSDTLLLGEPLALIVRAKSKKKALRLAPTIEDIEEDLPPHHYTWTVRKLKRGRKAKILNGCRIGEISVPGLRDEAEYPTPEQVRSAFEPKPESLGEPQEGEKMLVGFFRFVEHRKSSFRRLLPCE